MTREPGGTELGEQIRELVLHGDHVTPWAEALLYAASRAQHVEEVIRPALERGASVLCDRYIDSSAAYQGVARGLGLERVLDLNLVAVNGLLPDRTFLLSARRDRGDGTAEPGARPARERGRGLPRARRLGLPRPRGALSRAHRRPRRLAAGEGARGGGVWSASRRCLSSRRPSACWPRRSRTHRRTPFFSTAPPGVGKRTAAFAFAAALLGDERRVEARTHPDLYVLEPLGEMIRIDDVRALRHDLHMRPFEADRRVYLVLDAQRMNEDAADALLKDLEEPPPYATIVLVASELGPLPPTILSRCQLVPFRRLSERAVREWIAERAPDAARTRSARSPAPPPAARSRAPPARPRRGRPPRGADRRGALGLPRRRLRAGRGRGHAARGGRRARAGGEGARADRGRGPRPPHARGRPARPAGAARGRAGGAAGRARGARGVVPRPRRGRRGRRERGRERRPARGSARGRRARPRRGPAARGRGGARDLARARGVQPQPVPRARGALRPSPPGAPPRARIVVALVGCGHWGPLPIRRARGAAG